MDIVKAIQSEMLQKIESGHMGKVISEKVDHFVDKVIGDSFCSYGDVAKKLKTKVEEQIGLCLDSITLTQYNEIMTQMIQQRLGQVYEDDAKRHMEKVMDRVFKVPKESMKLSEIVDQVFGDEEDCRCSGEDRGSLHIDDGYSSLKFIYFDESPDKKDHDCEYKLSISSDGTISSATQNNWRGTKPIRPRPGEVLRSLEADLFQMMVYGTKVEIDIDESYVSTGY